MALEVVVLEEPLQYRVEVEGYPLLFRLDMGTHQEDLNRLIKSFHCPLRLRVVWAPVRYLDLLLFGKLRHSFIDEFSPVVRLQDLWLAVDREEIL